MQLGAVIIMRSTAMRVSGNDARDETRYAQREANGVLAFVKK